MVISMPLRTPRAHVRTRVLWDATLHQEGRTWACKAVDVSPGGAKIQIDHRLAVSSYVMLVIVRLGSFPGEVRWQDESLAGIQFLQDPAAVEERLRRARQGAVCRARPEQLCGPQRARQHETRRLA